MAFLVPFADVHFAGDYPWWQEYWPDVTRQLEIGKLWTTSACSHSQFGIRYVRADNGEGLHCSPGWVSRGGNSGHQAVNLAFHMLGGRGRLTLMGFDMGRTDGRSHVHGDHRGTLGNGGPFDRWIHRLDNLVYPALRRYPIQLSNATRTTRLAVWPRCELEEVLK